MNIFSDFVENCIEVFVDDITIYENSFDECLSSLELIMKRCIQTKLVLNYEKCHFIARHNIVLGHLVSSNRIELDKAKVDVIYNLSYPTCVRNIRSF